MQISKMCWTHKALPCVFKLNHIFLNKCSTTVFFYLFKENVWVFNEFRVVVFLFCYFCLQNFANSQTLTKVIKNMFGYCEKSCIFHLGNRCFAVLITFLSLVSKRIQIMKISNFIFKNILKRTDHGIT
jgi:hypothetical protein